jgi:Rhodopirellula transposase DDE domain
MEFTDAWKTTLMETATTLHGAERRLFLARTVQALGPGGQRIAEEELGWNRGTIRKGMHELESGITCCDAFYCRGRLRAEELLPDLLEDIQDLAKAQSQTDPRFRTQRLYTRLTAEELRRQLQVQKGYTATELPAVRTLRSKLNELGFHLTKVAKCKPKKRSRKQTPSSSG